MYCRQDLSTHLSNAVIDISSFLNKIQRGVFTFEVNAVKQKRFADDTLAMEGVHVESKVVDDGLGHC